ncbi:MAG: heavy-metal-associated domain-containing protein [Gammaproteobacteria bacterium]|nr:heavy-metal-associated domain-containing protein [Gammaproteobacteria bacterium]
MISPVAIAEQVYHIGIHGLTCPFCVYGAEKQLHKLDGVNEIESHLEQGLIVVKMHDGKTLEKPQVEKAIKKSGFSLNSFGLANK